MSLQSAAEAEVAVEAVAAGINARGCVAETGPVVATAGPKLWNANFYLLWQGQMVSAVGDTVYAIALGFWILARTGSTALMGTLMAAAALPRILASPFAGVIVDRTDRKWLLVAMDAVRGIAVVLVALAAYTGTIHVWMVFAAGIIIGLGSAFFFPAIGSAIPDIVPPKSIVQANSAFALLGTGSGVIGSAAGGFLFQLLGAPLMFLANGLSYLVAAGAAVPVRIPRVNHGTREFRFFRDLGTGFTFVWKYRGIAAMLANFAVLNFFAGIGFMLLLPLFHRTAGLGAAKYGLLMACLTGGMFAGYIAMSFMHVEYRRRFAVFYTCGVVSMACAALLPVWPIFPLMLALATVFGATNAVLNSFINATFQAAVPQELRGKVFSLVMMVAGGLTPIAYAAGGALAEVLPLRALLSGSFLVTLICFAPLAAIPQVRRLVRFDPEKDTLEAIR